MSINVRRVIADPLFYSNCFIVACSETSKGIVIDPGNRNEAVAKAAEEDGVEIVAVVYTHGHIDHIGGAAGAKAVFDAPLLLHEGDNAALALLPQQAAGFGVQNVDVPTIDRWLSDGEKVEFSECSLEVIHTPGHSPGSVCLLSPPYLFSGDTLFRAGVGRTDFPGGDYQSLVRSIKERLWRLSDELILLPGHGDTSLLGEEKRWGFF